MMRLTCADVKKPLASITKIVGKGNKVIFSSSGSYIENERTGLKTIMREEGGVYVFDVWVPSEGDGQAEMDRVWESSGFSRRE